MSAYEVKYTTRSHNMTAVVIAQDELAARQLINKKPDLEVIASITQKPLHAPQIVSDRGWNKRSGIGR